MSFAGDPDNPFERGGAPSDQLDNSFEPPEPPAPEPRPIWPLSERIGRAWPVRAVGWLFVVAMLLMEGSCVWALAHGLPQIAEPPCGQMSGDRCLETDSEVAALYTDALVCFAPEKQVCLVPLGATSESTIEAVVDHYKTAYDLDVRVLPPVPIPGFAVSPMRQQIEAENLLQAMGRAYRSRVSDEAILIGVTPADMYTSGRPEWVYAFGVWQQPDLTAEGSTPATGVISTYRMDPANLGFGTYGLGDHEELMRSRLLKMLTKYVGALYYGLPDSDDPHSAVYDHILSPRDLDRMSDHLELPAASSP